MFRCTTPKDVTQSYKSAPEQRINTGQVLTGWPIIFWQEDRQGLTTASPRLAATHTGGSGSDELEYVATEQVEGSTAEAGCW